MSPSLTLTSSSTSLKSPRSATRGSSGNINTLSISVSPPPSPRSPRSATRGSSGNIVALCLSPSPVSAPSSPRSPKMQTRGSTGNINTLNLSLPSPSLPASPHSPRSATRGSSGNISTLSLSLSPPSPTTISNSPRSATRESSGSIVTLCLSPSSVSAPSSPRSPRTATHASSGNGSVGVRSLSPIAARSTFDHPGASSSPTKINGNDDHSYRPPGPSDSRCPCPALNTLANHGYLPRDGKNIHISMLIEALQLPETYNLSQPLATFLAGGEAILSDHTSLEKLPILFDKAKMGTLHDFAWHNPWGVEHDASIVHEDAPKGAKYAPVRTDTCMLNQFLGNRQVIGLEDVARRRVEIEQVLEKPLDAMHAEIARGEWALVLDIFGDNGKVPVDALRVWLHDNRFPEGWHATHKEKFFGTVATSSKLRHAMKDIKDEGKNDGWKWENLMCPFMAKRDVLAH